MDEIIAQIIGYVRGVWHRRWYILLVAWPICIAGWMWVNSLPDEYRASARVFVDTESLLAPLMSGLTIQPRVEQRLEMVTRTLLSRPNMEEVARRADLDITATTPAAMEQLINDLQEGVNLSGGGRQNLYSISYTSSDPEQARQVVQALVNLFVESSLGSSRTDLASSQRFLDQQIAEYETRLQEQEQKLQAYKRDNAELLATGGADYYARLSEARQRLADARLELEQARRQLRSYQRRLSGEEMVVLPTPPRQAGPAGSRTPEIDSRIAELRRQLDTLRVRYTDQHPEVVSTQRMIADLEAEREQALSSPSMPAGQPADNWAANPEVNTYLQGLQLSVADAESRVAAASARVEEYQSEVARLESLVARLPEVQSNFQSMNRSYEILRSSYEQLLERRQTATLSGDLQAQSDAVEFRVVDPPFVPSDPIGPNRLLLVTGILVVGLGAGVAVAFLLSQLRRTVDTPGRLARLTERPLLGCVSLHETAQALRRRRLRLAAFAAGAFTLVGAYGVVVVVVTAA